MLFIDFSSAFNTIKPHIMMRKLYDMNVNCNLIKQIFNYLTLPYPLIFTLYTNASSSSNCTILKYADDTVIIGNIWHDDISSYKNQVETFVKWCDSNFLNLNVRKTKELIMDFRKDCTDHDTLIVQNENVEIVDSYKYLGVLIDHKLRFTQNCQYLYTKCIRRVCYFRQLVNIKVQQEILTLFYRSIIESILSFCIVSWFGLSNKKRSAETVQGNRMGKENRHRN